MERFSIYETVPTIITNHTTHFEGCDCFMDRIRHLESANAKLVKALEYVSDGEECSCAEYREAKCNRCVCVEALKEYRGEK